MVFGYAAGKASFGSVPSILGLWATERIWCRIKFLKQLLQYDHVFRYVYIPTVVKIYYETVLDRSTCLKNQTHNQCGVSMCLKNQTHIQSDVSMCLKNKISHSGVWRIRHIIRVMFRCVWRIRHIIRVMFRCVWRIRHIFRVMFRCVWRIR
jgi:hypothetical protein